MMFWPLTKENKPATPDKVEQTAQEFDEAVKRLNRAIEKARERRKRLFGEDLLGNSNATDR